ncbi:CopD family protein [Paraburkholderia sp. BL10I2N1]|uniref:copper resistance D family protein n=1 Tax=Paraburkholderia sp. BL10I2N1 TaxID=1938796 RepID=UPI001060C59E|nr:CopD family protein [Paraburkholderia sp. BL10I2N1]TDN63057.1 putative copper resistance protein D [Paraburkholderia sp. BL10I2N1]
MDPVTISGSIIVAAVANVLFACAVGACLAALMLDNASPRMRYRLRWIVAVCVVTLIVADTVNLLFEAALMSGSAPGADLLVLIPVLTQSHFGTAWSTGFVALIVWTGLLVGSRGVGRPAQTSVALFAAAVFAFSRAASSHAADAGDFSLPEWIHWVHLCATAAWAGLVIASGLSVLPMLRADAPADDLARFVGRLSGAAIVALSAVLVSGIYNADRGLGGSLVPLTHSDWGLILDAKLALVSAAVVLGGVNRQVYLPRIRRGASQRAAASFLTILRAEAVAMIGILSAAAVLAHTVPGAHLGT